MPRALITGGTGTLGRELVPTFAAAGYTVRVMSRRPRSQRDPDVEWAQADLLTGSGLAEAASEADLIVHAASSVRRTAQSDVEGTARLLEAAGGAGVSHFLYVSIVGVDRVPLGYYRHKLAAERRIEEAGVPWSILRATQFHTLIDVLLRAIMRFPVALVPTDFRFQPIDPGDVADRIVGYVPQGPAGRLPDLGGPEVHTLGDLARIWAEVRGLRRCIIRLPLLGKVAAGFRRGYNTTPENAYGSVTWADWLRQRYGPDQRS